MPSFVTAGWRRRSEQKTKHSQRNSFLRDEPFRPAPSAVAPALETWFPPENRDRSERLETIRCKVSSQNDIICHRGVAAALRTENKSLTQGQVRELGALQARPKRGRSGVPNGVAV